MVHEMTLLMMGRKLFLAPLPPSPQRVIDVGTGTGIWAIDFGKIFSRRRPPIRRRCLLCHVIADKYPSAEVCIRDKGVKKEMRGAKRGTVGIW
jgi:hypothetical protein